MLHLSLPKDSSIEFINVEPMPNNPFFSKCHIKVCYVGDTPNRNGTIITKEVATKMARTLPGCPIVGFYNEHAEDFEEHNKMIDLSNNQFEIKDLTRPYGFVDLNPKIWFQKFIDDGQDVREYLVTEGYIWNGIYPEASRVLTKGNNQSMELDEKTLQGNWTTDGNSSEVFFIINEALFTKLCILGEQCEPCFEGAQIKTNFSLNEKSFEINKLILEFKKNLEGGYKDLNKTLKFSLEPIETNQFFMELYSFAESQEGIKYNLIGVYSEQEKTYALLSTEDNKEVFSLEFTFDEVQGFKAISQPAKVDAAYAEKENLFKFDNEAIVAFAAKKKKEKEGAEGVCAPKDKDKNKKEKYCLDEVVEYTELLGKYNLLVASNNQVIAERDTLLTQVGALTEFKNATQSLEKKTLIASFTLLTEEEKKDVVENINTYSLSEIESKLSVAQTRKQRATGGQDATSTFGLSDMSYNINGGNIGNGNVPPWLAAVLKNQENK